MYDAGLQHATKMQLLQNKLNAFHRKLFENDQFCYLATIENNLMPFRR